MNANPFAHLFDNTAGLQAHAGKLHKLSRKVCRPLDRQPLLGRSADLAEFDAAVDAGLIPVGKKAEAAAAVAVAVVKSPVVLAAPAKPTKPAEPAKAADEDKKSSRRVSRKVLN